MVSFECHIPLMGTTPLVLALQSLLVLHFQGGKGSVVSMHLEGVTYTQFEGSTGLNTWALVNMVNGSIHSLNSLMHSTSWCDSPSRVGLDRLAQCCRALAYAKVFCIASTDSPVSQTSDPSSGGRCHDPDKVGWVALCNG